MSLKSRCTSKRIFGPRHEAKEAGRGASCAPRYRRRHLVLVFRASPASQVPKKDPHPVCCPLPALPAPPAPDPDPVLPPNIKFFGYGTVPNGTARRAFFTDGQDVYVVAEGEVLLNRYRILRVGNATLEFEEVTSGRKGRAALEEQAGPSA